MNSSRGPLFIAIVVLLLPLLYVGSYFALVMPGEAQGSWMSPLGRAKIKYMITSLDKSILWENYRCGDRYGKVVFWPLEQVDRRVRPSKWNPAPVFPLVIPSYAGILSSEETKATEEIEE